MNTRFAPTSLLQTIASSGPGPLLVPECDAAGIDGLPTFDLHHQAICGLGAARGQGWVEFLVRGVGACAGHSAMTLVRAGYASRGAGFDLAVLDRALRLARLLDRGTRLGVNIHPASLHDPDFTAAVLQRMKSRPELAGRLVLELVEFQGAVDLQRCCPALEQLRRADVRIALDDFGPGSPNLDLIAGGLIDALKLDRSLVDELDRAPRQLDLLRGLVELARSTGVELVAEGVETVAQFEQLRRIGVPWMQGYLFSRPGPVRRAVATVSPKAWSSRRVACPTPTPLKEIHA